MAMSDNSESAGEGRILSRADIQAASDTAPVPVDVPAWGGKVLIRPMTLADRSDFDDVMVKRLPADESERRSPAWRGVTIAVYLSRCICDEAGDLMFDDEAGVAILRKRSYDVLVDLFNRSSAINAISESDLDELEGNSEGDPNDASPSTSPDNSASHSESSGSD